jgi:crotonobetainyl-CoA:carnitine CoA-transferase CaiB-like acyl-CoA transferase
MVPGIYGMFATADGWIAIVGVAGPLRDRFYETIGRPDLIERFSGLLYFEDDKAALWPILDEAFATKTTAEWCELLGTAGLRFAPVRNHAEVVVDPGVRANGYVETVENPDTPGPPVDVVKTPVRFSEDVASVPLGPPELGQHTEEVLLETGYSWDDITSLSDDGVI